MIVQASEQVFLLSGGDQGLSLFISELNHPTGVRKKGEEILFGSNFDSSVEMKERQIKNLKLKKISDVSHR